MQAELIFSGVPKGEDYLGPNEDKIYFSTFYNGSKSENNRFLVEVRRSGDKAYCYYNYLLSNTIDSENRSGGYFCMSLRLDMFCMDVVNMYRFMDLTYNKYINNNLLAHSSNSLRYQIMTFEQKQSEYQLCQNCLLELIQKFMSGRDFVPIDNSFNLTKSGVPEYNFCDCTKDIFLAIIKKYAAISCSSVALLQREISAQQKFDSRLASAIKAKDNEISNTGITLQNLKNQNTQLQTDASQLRDEIEKLKKDIKQKDVEIKQYSLRQNVSQIISQIKDPINKLASFTEQSFQENKQKDWKEKEKQDSLAEKIVRIFLPILNFLVLLGIVAYLFFGFGTKSINNGISSLQTDNPKNVETQVNPLSKTEADPILTKDEQPIATPNVDKKNEQITVNSEPNNLMDYSKVKIDIIAYSGGGAPLKYGKTYTVKIFDAPAAGEWKVEHLKIERENPQELVVVANELGSVSISYEIGGQVAKKRDLIVESFE